MVQAMKNLNLLPKKKKRYVIDLQTAKGKYNPNDSIKFETGSIESSLCDYICGFVSVDADNNTDVAFKNALFSTCKAEIDDVFINETNYIYITIPMYNLIEYSDNYSDR